MELRNPLCFVAIIALNGCVVIPIERKDYIGKYEGALPDGKTESLELKSDGTCKQEICLEDGRKFSRTGTWIYTNPGRNLVFLFGKQTHPKGLGFAYEFPKIDSSSSEEKELLRKLPVVNSLTRSVMIGDYNLECRVKMDRSKDEKQ